MENNKIQDIITKSLLKEASLEELSILESWRSESEQNEQDYQSYAQIWTLSADYTPTNFQPNAQRAYEKHLALLTEESTKEVDLPIISKETVPTQKKAKVFTLRRLASIAALFVFVLGALFIFNLLNTTTITADNGVAFAALEDGTSIWLDKGSSLTYKNGFGEYHRDVTLEGRAFFDVEKNKDLQFNIVSDELNVAVLGTSFTVDAKSESKSVSVKTGKVSVESNQQSIILLPNEKATVENNKFVASEADRNDILWRNSDLSFENARLDQVIADINLFHNDKITLKGSTTSLECPFTSKSLINTSFENIIEILEITYDLETEKTDEEGSVILTISSCR